MTTKPEQINNWPEFVRWVRRTKPSSKRPHVRWIFRGECRNYGGLTTSLERAAKGVGITGEKRRDLEERLIHEFRRRLHHYSVHVPHPLDYLEILALMQHYGAPTRLLDWTYSPYVAAYFAMENAKKEDGRCVIHAVECFKCIWGEVQKTFTSTEIDNVFDDQLRKYPHPPELDARDPDLFKLPVFLFHAPKKCIFVANPYRLNERLSIQQGVFLMPGDVRDTFVDNFKAAGLKQHSVAIKTDRRTRHEFLLELHRMNISAATLYPGLAGYAQSLHTRLVIPETLSAVRPRHGRLPTSRPYGEYMLMASESPKL